MKLIFCELFIVIAVISGIHGGGDSICNSYIETFEKFSPQLQVTFPQAIKQLKTLEPIPAVNFYINYLILNADESITSIEVEALIMFRDSGDEASTCIVSYLKSQNLI
ncbi:unnamed protein product [Chironomus riparius]|uniref:Uncharacterized protein n=1 Tax=Chironomus riparius TaxID=315576 RepID=A0A9N9S6M0_9DIPT|nr:unnamed protein product [Chironomus riparius]